MPKITTDQKKRVAAYARVSDNTEAHSLSAQVSYFSALIQKHPEWDYAGIYADEGVTGTSIKKRDEFKRLMADCDAGKIDIVLVKSISRFARDTVDCLNAIRHLKDIGVEVRFEREGISTFSPDGELLITLLAAFAQAESESISANVKWAIRKRFSQGIPNGHKAPFGYRWDNTIYRIILGQGEIVKEIFSRYLAGESAYSIAKCLAAKGQNGLPIRDYTVKDIISNISYTGKMILQKNFITESHVRKRNRGELNRYVVEDMFEPLISMEDYERAQAIRQQRASEMPAVTRTPFSGKVRCGWCGSGVSRRSNKEKWVCNSRERKGTCSMRPVTEKELEDAAARELRTHNVGTAALVTDNVSQIVIFGDRIEFCLTSGQTTSVMRKYGWFNVKGAFSGMLICGNCGAKLERDTWKNRDGSKTHSWGCTTLRSSCSLKRIREDDLIRAASLILHVEECEPAFVERVRQAVVYNDAIRFELKNGTEEIWQRAL